MNSRFVFPENATGYLSPENVYFFYYTVGKGELEGESYIYEWNDEIINFLHGKDITIEERERVDLPMSFAVGEIYFIREKKVQNILESKPMAFIRHLRNAFAHYHIREQQDYFLMKDYSNEKCRDEEMTMIGKIKQDDLKELCILLLKQGEMYNENTSIVHLDEL